MNKRETSLILSRTSLIISLAYMALLSYFFIFSLNNTDDHSGLGMLLAFMLPHLFAFLLAVILNNPYILYYIWGPWGNFSPICLCYCSYTSNITYTCRYTI